MQTQTVAAPVPQKTTAVAYALDPSHSSAQFAVRHLMISTVRGEIPKLAGRIVWDPARPEATSIEATLDVASIQTREPARDEHLRSADFFDVARFPTMTFVSRAVRAAGAGRLAVTGDLTLHGVTRSVVLDVEGPEPATVDPWGKERIGASARTKIRRSEFGLVWNTPLAAGGVLVGEEVTITLDVSLVRDA